MNTEQREEIEKALRLLQDVVDYKELHAVHHVALETVLQFARQQLNLRVDVEKLMEKLSVSIDRSWQGTRTGAFRIPEDIQDLESIVLECITTTPEEKE